MAAWKAQGRFGMAGLMVICSSNGRGGPGIMMASTVWSRSMEAHGLERWSFVDEDDDYGAAMVVDL